MICCKITADYYTICKNFTNIIDELSLHGLVLWDNQKLYFANTDEVKISSSFVKRVLKKNECKDFFLEIYDEKHEPHENESANIWIQNQLVVIGYNALEKEHQDVLKQMSEQLAQLDEEVTKVLEQATQTSQKEA